MNTSRHQQATAYILFQAITDIQLNMYDRITMLIHYDPSLHTKLKNLKANFERESKRGYHMFDEAEQLTFFQLVNIIEALIESAKSKDSRKFSELVSLVKAHQNNELTIINTKEELVATAKMTENEKDI